ncbi:hypothetical protein CRG98_044210 [Punica granatum]|uniref:Uncharacterized protein n=1 Tax=Punica granatum TaxID=22663 RepID=A0A2I0HV52_PUNGR|nr:hypothetical protein CRG98_044210 [Punica granatum]
MGLVNKSSVFFNSRGQLSLVKVEHFVLGIPEPGGGLKEVPVDGHFGILVYLPQDIGDVRLVDWAKSIPYAPDLPIFLYFLLIFVDLLWFESEPVGNALHKVQLYGPECGLSSGPTCALLDLAAWECPHSQGCMTDTCEKESPFIILRSGG